MKSVINDATGLLEKCLCNGDKGSMALYGWFMGERHLIKATIRELNEMDYKSLNACPNYHTELKRRNRSICPYCGEKLSGVRKTHLIAAAPELLEVLQGIKELTEHRGSPEENHTALVMVKELAKLALAKVD